MTDRVPKHAGKSAQKFYNTIYSYVSMITLYKHSFADKMYHSDGLPTQVHVRDWLYTT